MSRRLQLAWSILPLLALGFCSCMSDRSFVSSPRHPSSGSTNQFATPRGPQFARAAGPEAPSHSTGIMQAAYAQPMPHPVPVAGPSEPAGNPAHLYPDEYLFDGGDRDRPVHFDDFRRLGLDTEDTVAEYTDHHGKRHVKPTNRVAVYSPRFAAVRTVSQPVAGVGAKRPTGFQDDVHVAGLGVRKRPGYHKQRDVPNDVRVRTRGSGIDGDRIQVTFDRSTSPAANRTNQKPLENLTFLRTGELDRTQEAVLAAGIQGAVVWTKKHYPVIVGSTQEAGEVSAEFQFQEFVGREDMRKTPGKLRIVKVADKDTAQPGETITFTIRYDNLGDRELHHIRIVDNLTPRLEYVKDSADSDRKGKLFVENNAEGSLVLKFELSEPLPGHTGGVVKFQARVR